MRQLDAGQHAEAEITYTKALPLARQSGYWRDEAFALSMIGELRQMAGDQAGAGAFLREARQVRERSRRPSGGQPRD